MIHEIIVVEGKDDVAALKRALDCECMVTHGYGFGEDLLVQLQQAQMRRGLIVLTDPDYAGKRIRARIREAVPEAKHAFLERKYAYRGDDIGVENAPPEAIREAIFRAHATMSERRTEFSKEDLLRYGLEGCAHAKARRIALGDALGIGYGNAKQLLVRLNEFGVERAEVETAMEQILREET